MNLASLFFDPNWPFCKPIAFAIWPFLAISKMLSFLEYYLFFFILFSLTTTSMWLKSHFSYVLSKFIFWPKLTILQGLESLTGGHFCQFSKSSYFSNIFFSICFLPKTTIMWLWNHFSHLFSNFIFSPKLTILQRL